jgi:hypothetical protein
MKKPKLKQSKSRKKVSKFYCKRHQLYYMDSCFICECERLVKDIRRIEEWN